MMRFSIRRAAVSTCDICDEELELVNEFFMGSIRLLIVVVVKLVPNSLFVRYFQCIHFA